MMDVGSGTEAYWANARNFYPDIKIMEPMVETREQLMAKSAQQLSKCKSKRCQAEIMRVGKRVRDKCTLVDAVKRALMLKFGQVPSHSELHVIARFVSDESGVPIDRDALRRKNALFVWCGENMGAFMTVLEKIIGERELPPDSTP